jgi:hypothetical protein
MRNASASLGVPVSSSSGSRVKVKGEVFRGEQRKLREPRWTEGHEKSPLEGGLNPYLGRHGGDRFSINPSALGAIHLLRRNNEKWALERN